MSSSAVVLTLTAESGGGPPTFTAGTYNIGSSYVIDGGFYSAYYGFPPAAEVYAINGSPVGTNPSQEFNFVASGIDFTTCNVPDGDCLTDGGSDVDLGQGTDTWLIAASGSGWTLKNTRTGKYLGVNSLGFEGQCPHVGDSCSSDAPYSLGFLRNAELAAQT